MNCLGVPAILFWVIDRDMRPAFKLAIGLVLAGTLLIAAVMHFGAQANVAEETSRSTVSAEKPVPVLASPAIEQEVPIYRRGLGFVEAFNKVSVTSRVEGQLVAISFTEGQEVAAGAVLAQLDSRSFEAILRSKEAILRGVRARESAAKVNLERMAELIQRNVGTKQALENQQALLEDLSAQVDGAEADVQSAVLQLEYTTIRSPIDGRVGLKQIDAGNLVRSGDPVVAIVTQVQPISVVFSLPQEDLLAVNSQMSVGEPMIVTATARDNKLDLGSGTLSTIDNQVDAKTGTFKLKAVFDNKEKTLWPGEFVSVKLLVENARKAIVVPASAIQRGPEGAYVYVLDAAQKAAMRSVSVGLVQDGFAIVRSGLTPGEQVVVEGQFKLRPGGSVILKEGAKLPSALSGASTQPRG
jgi:multidrug efflux system membrane fusion protein